MTIKPDPPNSDDLLSFTHTGADEKHRRKNGAPANKKLHSRLTKAMKKQRPSIAPCTCTHQQVPDGCLFRGLRTAANDDCQGIYLTKDSAEEEDLFADEDNEDADTDDDSQWACRHMHVHRLP